MINVAKPYLPDIQKYQEMVKNIFSSGWLTNNGQYTKQLSKRLEEYLHINHFVPVANGTLALQVAYKLLGLKGDVITTPFSFVATTSSLVWEGMNPIFTDIDERSLNIDPEKIEEKISPNTTAIVATHVFGNPCDVEKLQQIADDYNLKVIYDAAHAFGVTYKGKSIFEFGDISTASFHSTKVFHTIEGGGLAVKGDNLYEKANKIINFGISTSGDIEEVGINAKMNEFQAAMGLCVLDDFEQIINRRKRIYNEYISQLALIESISFQQNVVGSSSNYSYLPIILKDETTVNKIIQNCNEQNVYPRRYFYPSLNSLCYVNNGGFSTPISYDISKRILCLPMYDSLGSEDVQRITQIVRNTLK